MKSKELPIIARNIKRYRQKQGISQDKLSKLANIACNVIIKIESAQLRIPQLKRFQKSQKD